MSKTEISINSFIFLQENTQSKAQEVMRSLATNAERLLILFDEILTADEVTRTSMIIKIEIKKIDLKLVLLFLTRLYIILIKLLIVIRSDKILVKLFILIYLSNRFIYF